MEPQTSRLVPLLRCPFASHSKKRTQAVAETTRVSPRGQRPIVANREDVLALYAEPYDPKRPKVNFDETSKQLIKETHAALSVEAVLQTPEGASSTSKAVAHAGCFTYSRLVAGHRSELFWQNTA